MEVDSERQISLLEALAGGRRANAQRECDQARFGGNWVGLEGRYGSKRRVQQGCADRRRRRMGRYANRARNRFDPIRVMVRNNGHR